MPSKNFCDICDTEIKEGDRIFSLVGNAGGDRPARSMSLDGSWVDPNFNYPMICKRDYVQIVRLLESSKTLATMNAEGRLDK